MAEHLLGASIAAYRKKAGMTQEDLGRALFVSGQAVSRWERGGTPDSDMLPKIADVLGISLDTLFGRSQTPQTQLETLLTQELKLTPDGRRIQRATQLAWHMMKVIAASSGEPGNSFFRAMTANEDLDRRGAENPDMVPVNNYFSFNDGLLQSCVAKDFQYVLLMREPEFGYASIMKNNTSYQRFFSFLAKVHRLDALVLANSLPVDRNFTEDFVASRLSLPPEEVREILTELYELHFLRRGEIQGSDGIQYVYSCHDETLFVPFLYFAGELMKNGPEVYYSVPMREGALFHDPLGENALSPDWSPSQKRSVSDIGAGFSSVK